ncbi:MAG TPA: hypothetical protein DCE42_01155 [Myxococcales bacterium]|nr:hypothetical protein [Deltaproteobacteria bacterium]MBU49125.1 hypothetical protein [Deltaproteobacteria bacterium]HAA53329.1 hypothetical protein [Myxococcales bacterium]|tara:strand:- start:5355 stop:6017 length:663 start_codon:yes stop_codon:yes gene_type:complete
MTAKRSNRQMGFSLIELMIGLVAISIMGAFLVWGARSFSQSYRVRLAVREIVGLLNYARGQALVTQKAYRVQFIPGGAPFKDLKPLGAGSSAERGVMFVAQGASSIVSRGFKLFNATTDEAGLERKTLEFRRRYSDVSIYRVNMDSTKTQELNLYFMPDGTIANCRKSGVTAICNPYATYDICIKVNDQTTGPNSIPRRISVSFNGQIKVKPSGNATLCK